MPDTPRRLGNWPNHYSLFGEQMWLSLFTRSGFNVRAKTHLQIRLQIDDINDGKPFDETNYVYVLEKIRDEGIYRKGLTKDG